MLDSLIRIFSALPGLGPKSAKRIVLHLIEREGISKHLGDLLEEARSVLRFCADCNNIGEGERCAVCLAKGRDRSKICVVDGVEDLWNIESTGHYNGLYYIPPKKPVLSNQIVAEIEVAPLVAKVVNGGVDEVILANSPTVKGQTNAFYITECLKDAFQDGALPFTITTLGRGIPIGSEIDYLDESTIKAAFQSRKTAA